MLWKSGTKFRALCNSVTFPDHILNFSGLLVFIFIWIVKNGKKKSKMVEMGQTEQTKYFYTFKST